MGCVSSTPINNGSAGQDGGGNGIDSGVDGIDSGGTDSATGHGESGGAPASDGGGAGEGGGSDGAIDGSGGSLSLLDCSDPGNATDKKCVRPACAFGGALGTGPKIGCSSGFPEIRFGFVDTASNRLVVAVEMGVQADGNGMILGVDLASGNRTMLSGQYQDPATGTTTKGTGPDLDDVWDVKGAPDGSWVAIVYRSSTLNRQIVRIDPATGNRTSLLNAGSVACTGASNSITPDYSGGLAVGDDGSLYLPLDGNPQGSGYGIAKFSGSPLICSVTSLTGATNAGDNKGSGPANVAVLRGLQFQTGKVWAIADQTASLFSVDVATGNRLRVSSSDSSTTVGTGGTLGVVDLAIGHSVDWTIGQYAGGMFQLASVDPSTGNRTAYMGSRGPVVSAQASNPGVWVYPGSSLLVLTLDNAFILYEPSNDNSNTFSW
jgi:hypothetical protein